MVPLYKIQPGLPFLKKMINSGLHLVVWPLYSFPQSVFSVDCETLTPVLWWLAMMLLTVVFGFFLTAQDTSRFFQLQIVVVTVLNVCAKALPLLSA